MTFESIWHTGRPIVLAGLVIYLLVSVYMTLFQSRLVYYPTREIERTPGDAGLAYEQVAFTSGDDVALTGWFIPAQEERGVVLFCHGNGGNISHRIETITIMNMLGLSIFIFDYRGYGHSGGKPTEKGTYRDAEAAWMYLVENRGISPQEIVIHGRSLGGAVAAWLALKHTPKAFILESSFTSVPDVGAEFYPWLPVKLISRFNYPTITYIRELSCPVLVIHSSEDDLLPYSHGRRLFEAAAEPKEFLDIHGTHNDGYIMSGKHYIDGLNSFIERYAILNGE